MAITPAGSIPVKIKRSAIAKLNSDVDPLELGGGDYTARVNVEFNSDGETFADTPSLGNRRVTSLGSQGLQKQRNRIYIDKIFSRVFITLKNNNGQTIGSGSAASLSALANNKQAIINVFSGFVTSQSFFNDLNSEPYIDVEVESGYSDYFLEITDQDGQNIRQTILFEAISNTGVGTFKEIGSLQLNDSTFLFATTQDKELTQIAKIDAVFRIGSGIVIQVNGHGLVDNDTVVVSNCIGIGAIANGEWTITVISADVFALNFSVAGTLPIIPTPYQGDLFINAYGVGMIGVQTYNVNNDSYDFIKLIASKRFNFTTLHQIDVTGEVNNRGYLIKYTDDYNPPRTYSYEGEFVENGSLSAFFDTGFYTYDNLVDDIKNLVNYSQAEVTFLEQLQSGGSVPPANWRYAVRFITSSGSASEISLLSNPIPTFSTPYNINTDIVYGNAVGDDVTGKINRLLVTGITAGRFEFVDLIGYNYASSIASTTAVTAYRIRRESLDVAQTEIILEHNGNEPDITFLDATTSNAVRPDIIRVGSNRLIDNRLVYGKVTTSTSLDIRDWVQTFKYSIKRFPLYGSFGAETFYEFFDPSSTANYVGYQKWEWYRFYVAAETKSGIISDAVFAFDVRFVSQADYDQTEFETTNLEDRRDFTGDEFVDYSIGTDRFLYQYYLQLKNVDWTYRINGVLVSDLFNSIKIIRAERVTEVIADGTILLSAKTPDTVGSPTSTITDYTQSVIVPNVSGAVETDVVDYGTSGITNTTTRTFCSFYSPDIIFGFDEYSRQDGDRLLNFGSLEVASTQNYFNPYQNAWRIWRYNNTEVTTPQVETIQDFKFVTSDSSGEFGSIIYTKNVNFIFAVGTTNGLMESSPVLQLENPLVNQNSFTDSGQYYGLIFRRKFDKYGSRDSIGNTVVFTGTTISVGESEGDVFGGDVFNQQLQFRFVRPSVSNSSCPSRAFNIISSNRINVNLRAYNPDNPTLAFPVNPPNDFTIWLATITQDDFTKNSGYNIFNNVQSQSIFDVNSKDRGFYPVRKFWSQVNPDNSQIDRYREFLPLDFQDSPNVYGEITHLEVINGELFTIQRNMFTREFFNSTGRLVSAEDGSILIGDGSVLSREGMRMTKRGTKHKWSATLGYSDSGKDVIYWADTSTASIMRFGSDGSQNLTQRAMYDTFFRNNIRFVSERFTPANGQGLHGVWDDIGKNYILTCRAWKDVEPYNEDLAYKNGQVASLGEDMGIPIFYLCIKDYTVPNSFPPPNEEYWRKIEFSENDYYNVWTLVFNEKKNGFTHHYTFYPKIYHVLDNRYFSPSPYSGEEAMIYRHRDLRGQEIVYYGRDNEGYTEYVVNDYANINKKFASVGYVALLKPLRIEVFSQFISETSGIVNRQTFMDRDIEDDMEMRENIVFSSVKNDLDELGRPDQDTAPMRGLYAKIRTYFKAKEKQKINECTVSIRMGQKNVLNT